VKRFRKPKSWYLLSEKKDDIKSELSNLRQSNTCVTEDIKGDATEDVNEEVREDVKGFSMDEERALKSRRESWPKQKSLKKKAELQPLNRSLLQEGEILALGQALPRSELNVNASQISKSHNILFPRKEGIWSIKFAKSKRKEISYISLQRGFITKKD
jgi:hypothetical protein